MIVVLMGAPGAGKGTQGDLLVERYGWKKVSTGDLLREEIRAGGSRGEELSAIIARGELVSDEILAEIIASAAQRCAGETMLLDGFPRSLSQATLLGRICQASSLLGAFHLKVDDELLLERLTGRLVCRECGASFHVRELPPKVAGVCDQCSGQLYTRPDDEPLKIENRLRVYQEHTEPVVDYFKQDNAYVAVDGEGSTQEVFLRLLHAIDTRVNALSSKE